MMLLPRPMAAILRDSVGGRWPVVALALVDSAERWLVVDDRGSISWIDADYLLLCDPDVQAQVAYARSVITEIEAAEAA